MLATGLVCRVAADDLETQGGRQAPAMANPNPHAARLSKRRAHKPGNLQAILKILWTAITDAEHLLYTAGDDADLRLRCLHALSQSCGQYSKLLEIGELEARLSALEQAMKESNGAFHGYATGTP